METVISTNKLGLGDLLRYWRESCRKSQLNLALDSGLSQRHLSFIENGRSIMIPSSPAFIFGFWSHSPFRYCRRRHRSERLLHAGGHRAFFLPGLGPFGPGLEISAD
jgi:hypothetical protein